MNKVTWILGSILLGGLLVTQVFAHGPKGGQGQGYEGHMMGSGMMGRGMGHGMMGQGDEHRYGREYSQPQKSIDEKDAKSILENYLKSTGNPNLKLGTIKDMGPAFEAEILTKEDSLVDKIVVDKKMGQIRSIY